MVWQLASRTSGAVRTCGCFTFICFHNALTGLRESRLQQGSRSRRSCSRYEARRRHGFTGALHRSLLRRTVPAAGAPGLIWSVEETGQFSRAPGIPTRTCRRCGIWVRTRTRIPHLVRPRPFRARSATGRRAAHPRRVALRQCQTGRMSLSWSLRPATPDDADWLADLKAEAMRPDLERLGLWDREWARRRFLDAFVPANSQVIEMDGRSVRVVAVRPDADVQ